MVNLGGRLLAGLAAMVAVIALSPSSATAATPSDWVPQTYDSSSWHYIQNFHSGKCLVGRGATDSTIVTQTDCPGTNDEWWRFYRMGWDPTWGEYYQIRNEHSGKCLVTRNGSSGGYAAYEAVQSDCGDYSDQEWFVGRSNWDGPKTVSLLNRHQVLLKDLRCLVVQGSDNWTQAFVYFCDYYADQRWVVIL